MCSKRVWMFGVCSTEKLIESKKNSINLYACVVAIGLK